jgi:aryl-alcohol dehydrogenase-like predicted oxidoreductase
MLDIWDHGLGDGLSRAIDEGLCAAAGVSVYCPERFAQALDLPAITVIQAPFNVFDRRLLDAGLLARAAASGRTVFLRSVFLQGLLTLVPDELPIGMGFAADALRRWRAACSEAGLAPDQAALGCALAYAPDAKIVIGCETVEQLARNLAVIAQPLEPRALAALDSLPPGEAQLIDPSQWPPHPPAVQEARP